MSARENLQLIRSYFERPGADAYAEDAEFHDMSQPRPLRGREWIGGFLEMFHAAFADGAYEVRGMVADDEAVVVEWTFRGTNTDSLMGAPATGRMVTLPGVTVHEVRGGRIARTRLYYDTGLLAEQLGLMGERVPSGERQQWAEWWSTHAHQP